MNMFRRTFSPGIIQERGMPRNGHNAQPGAAGTISLRELPAGGVGQVTALTGGHGLVARLAALGLTPGAMVTVLQNPGHGPLIVLVRESRLVLGRGEAGHVTVLPVLKPDDEQGR